MSLKILLNNRIVSLIDHPGIKYPRNVLETRIGYRIKTGKPYEKVPLGSITTREASELLRCSMSGTRQILRRKGVPFILVKGSRNSLVCHWDRRRFMDLYNSRPPVCRKLPGDWLTTGEVQKLLGLARSALYRMMISGVLVEKKARVRTSRGMRVKSFYSRESVEGAFSALSRRRRKRLNRKKRSDSAID